MFVAERLYVLIATVLTPKTRARQEEGAAMVEYGLLVAFIAVVALLGVKYLGTEVNDLFGSLTF